MSSETNYPSERVVRLPFVTLAAILLLGACKPTGEAVPAPAAALPAVAPVASSVPSAYFHLAKQDVVDTKLETQVIQHFVVEGVPAKENIEAEVRRRLDLERAGVGFRFHSSPTSVGIFVYRTEGQAKAGQGLWIAKAIVNGSDEPSFEFDQDRYLELSATPDTKRGRSEPERKAIFAQLIATEVRAAADASAGRGLEGELREEYRSVLAKQLDMTEDELIGIAVEAYKKGWTQ